MSICCVDRHKKIEMEDDAWESSTDVILDRCK